MSEGRQKAEWTQCSSLMALVANIASAKGKKPRKPDDFNPFVQRQRATNLVSLADFGKAMGIGEDE